MKLGLASNFYNEYGNVDGIWNLFKDVVDQWLVLDSHSQDNTQKRLQEVVGSKLILIDDDTCRTHTGNARNKLIELSTSMDWVLIIDGDERMLPEEIQKLKTLVDSDPDYDIIWLPRISNWSWDLSMAQGGADSNGIGPNRLQAIQNQPDWQPRLVKRTMIDNQSRVHFYRAAHEIIQGLNGVEIKQLNDLNSPVIDHFGRLRTPERKQFIHNIWYKDFREDNL